MLWNVCEYFITAINIPSSTSVFFLPKKLHYSKSRKKLVILKYVSADSIKNRTTFFQSHTLANTRSHVHSEALWKTPWCLLCIHNVLFKKALRSFGCCSQVQRTSTARQGENVTEIICISVKRLGLFIGTEEGEITARLPEALPSGRINSEPKSGKGSDVVCFSTRLKCDEERLGSETNILRKTSFWVKGQTSLSKNKGHTHADIHLTFTTWPVIATVIKNSPWCLLSFGKFELLAKMCVELEMCVKQENIM